MSSATDDIAARGTPNEVLEKLKAALTADGDFPARARIVNELLMLANNPKSTVSEITELILKEPSLATRILHWVNSAFYQRAAPIMTITHAVMHIGMRPLADLCGSLVLMQRFVPAAKRGGIFADSLKKSILTSLITSFLVRDSSDQGVAERGYLAGTFLNLGPLLLAYYFPQVHDAAIKRAKSRGQDVTQSLTEIMAVSPVELSLAIVEALDIPVYYRDLILEAHKPLEEISDDSPHHQLANALATASTISSILISQANKEDLLATLQELNESSAFERDHLEEAMKALPDLFRTHCRMIEMSFLSLPEYMINFDVEEEPDAEEGTKPTDSDESFPRYIEDIKQAIRDGEPISSVITAVMETLAFGLLFDRVLLLRTNEDKTELHGRMALGSEFKFDPKTIKRQIDTTNSEAAPDICAFLEGSLKIFGEPLFDDGWPIAAIPIGADAGKAVGVIYADKIADENKEDEQLDSRMQASLSILTDLLDQAVLRND